MSGSSAKNYAESGEEWVVGGVLNVVGSGQIQKDGAPVDLGGGAAITSNSITDASAVGKAVLTAADAAAARTAIGAGTSSQNLSNMTLQEAQEGTVTTGRAISPQVLRASMPNLSSVAELDSGATLEDCINKINEIISTISP